MHPSSRPAYASAPTRAANRSNRGGQCVTRIYRRKHRAQPDLFPAAQSARTPAGARHKNASQIIRQFFAALEFFGFSLISGQIHAGSAALIHGISTRETASSPRFNSRALERAYYDVSSLFLRFLPSSGQSAVNVSSRAGTSAESSRTRTRSPGRILRREREPRRH